MTEAQKAVVSQAIADWYRPGPKITEFHLSKAPTRVLIGGRGSGKTTAIGVACVGHGFHNAGAKVYLLRKTEESNRDTTLETFEQVFANMGTGYLETKTSLFKKIEGGRVFRLPSRKAVEVYNAWLAQNPRASDSEKVRWLETVGSRYCSWLQFAGVPSSQYRASRFRGFECSMLVLVEADQFEREDLDLAVACLRWKGSDPETCDEQGFIKDTCMVLDSNPPSPRHWIAKLEEDAVKDNDGSTKFWHVPTDENAHNLPPGYVANVKKTYRKNPAMYERMVNGNYAEAFEGKPVFWGFSQEHAQEGLGFPKGAYLIRGWDFGTTQAVIWSAYWEHHGAEYWWDLFEYFATQSDVETQCRQVREITNRVFPFWNDRTFCAGVLDYCDPAGNQKKDTGRSISTLNTNEFYPGYCYIGFQDQLTIYNRLLEQTDKDGNLVYRIDSKACPMLHVASMGGYRYPVEGEPGFGSGTPLKGAAGGNYDHIADASRYAKVNCLKAIKNAALTKSNPLVGKLAVKPKYNRKRRDY